MFAMILSVLVLDDPQDFMWFPPEVYRRYESTSEPRPLKQDTPLMLKYEWKLNRDEAGINAVPSNRETWTEFATILKPKLPTQIKRTTESSSESSSFGIHRHLVMNRVQNLWNAVLATRYPFRQHHEYSVYYKLTREPDSLHPHYEGTINSYPAITARAKTIEALEAKLLEMYCDYITQMVEEDLQPPVATPPEKKPVFTIADYLPLYDIIHEPSFIRPYYVAAFSLRPNIKAAGVNIDQLETSLLETYSKHLEEVAIGIRKIEGTAAMPTRSVNEGTSRDR